MHLGRQGQWETLGPGAAGRSKWAREQLYNIHRAASVPVRGWVMPSFLSLQESFYRRPSAAGASLLLSAAGPHESTSVFLQRCREAPLGCSYKTFSYCLSLLFTELSCYSVFSVISRCFMARRPHFPSSSPEVLLLCKRQRQRPFLMRGKHVLTSFPSASAPCDASPGRGIQR